MRVGVLTFHRAHNYGAVLQCYALQQILRAKGHEVRIIDYRQPWIEEFYKVYSTDMIRKCKGAAELLSYLKKTTKKFLLAPLKASHFKSFRLNYLSATEPVSGCSIPQEFDAYVIGSDQLWSLHCVGGEYDAVYTGCFDRPDKALLVGYAISADLASVEKSVHFLTGWVSRFDSLSFRESRIADKVREITGLNVGTCVDPTLLTDSSMWSDVIDHKWKDRNFVLVYEVRWKKENKGALRRKAAELARSFGDGCQVLDLSSGKYSVSDFVSMFRYARYVVTTSFHGTVFSLLFERPFYVFPLWNGYDLRYMELLHSVGAADRIMAFDRPLAASDMDFSSIRVRMDVLRASSSAFLDNSLEQE